MKYLLTIFLIAATTLSIHAQKKGSFVRIFDQNKSKIYKGHLVQVKDSSLVLVKIKDTIEVPVSQVATIKLRRSFGHTLAITTLITATGAAILGAASADPDAWIFGYTVAEGIAMGLVVGGGAGLVAGSLVAGTRNRPVFLINNSYNNWQKVKETLQPFTLMK